MADKIKELEEQLKAAKEAAQAEHVAEAQAIWDAKTYDWSINWYNSRWQKKPSDYTFVVERTLSMATQEAMAAWEARMQVAYDSWQQPRKPWYSDASKIESMQYILIGNLMTYLGGGTLLLKGNDDETDGFSHEPRLLTDLEVQSLKNGVVPDTLKR